jgi:hypothetical protein
VVYLEEDERTARVIDHLYDHIVLAAAHYDDALKHQFTQIAAISPVWSKERLWENYYTPICDELEEIWDEKMDKFLETLR